MTPFSSRCEILAELWLDYRDDEDFLDFISYNDLGLPLAYGITNSLAKLTENGEAIINETWNLLLAGLSIEEDIGFETLDKLFEYVEDAGLGD
jgi:hypothetical protein